MWTFASPRVFWHSLWCVFSLLFLFLIFHVFGFFPILFGLCLWIDVGFNSNTRVRLSFISLLTTHKSCVLFCEKKILDWFSLTFFFFSFFLIYYYYLIYELFFSVWENLWSQILAIRWYSINILKFWLPVKHFNKAN